MGLMAAQEKQRQQELMNEKLRQKKKKRAELRKRKQQLAEKSKQLEVNEQELVAEETSSFSATQFFGKANEKKKELMNRMQTFVGSATMAFAMQGQAAVHAKTKILHLKNQAQNQLSVPGF
jgi:hypothetical protein